MKHDVRHPDDGNGEHVARRSSDEGGGGSGRSPELFIGGRARKPAGKEVG